MLLSSAVTLDSPVQYDSPLPTEVDVVVIGAGIIGITTATELAENGSTVLVCEKGRVAGEQSSRNWGWIRQTGRDADELPLMIESLQLWKDAAGRTGENALTFNQHGVMYVSRTDEATRKLEETLHLLNSHGVESSLLTPSQVAARTPHASEHWKKTVKAGLWTASDGRVEPWGAGNALARAASNSGVLIKEHCAVDSIQHAASGQHLVETETGTVKCTSILIAGGMWSGQMTRSLGIHLPQLSVKATAARLDNTPELLNENRSDDGLALAPRLDGGYTMALSGYQEHFITRDSFRYLWPYRQAVLEKFSKTTFRVRTPAGYPKSLSSILPGKDSTYQQGRIMDAVADPRIVERMLAKLRQQHEHCENARVSHAWTGMIETTPDFVPVLDEVETHPGLFIATGFSGHGFGIAPGVAKTMANMIRGGKSQHDLSRFRLSRFTDGSKLKLGPI